MVEDRFRMGLAANLEQMSKRLVEVYLALLCARRTRLARQALWLISDVGALAGAEEDTQISAFRAVAIVRDVCILSLCAVATGDHALADQCEPLLAACRETTRIVRPFTDDGPGSSVRIRRSGPPVPQDGAAALFTGGEKPYLEDYENRR